MPHVVHVLGEGSKAVIALSNRAQVYIAEPTNLSFKLKKETLMKH